MGLDSGVISLIENGGRDVKVFKQIAQYESDHVAFLIAGTAAFDEPLSTQVTVTIANLFIV